MQVQRMWNFPWPIQSTWRRRSHSHWHIHTHRRWVLHHRPQMEYGSREHELPHCSQIVPPYHRKWPLLPGKFPRFCSTNNLPLPKRGAKRDCGRSVTSFSVAKLLETHHLYRCCCWNHRQVYHYHRCQGHRYLMEWVCHFCHHGLREAHRAFVLEWILRPSARMAREPASSGWERAEWALVESGWDHYHFSSKTWHSFHRNSKLLV
mmetsp:Transcript_6589/g.13775  ORF Transcript_6589/g.13775 Transcript_6589/m.13775 type:complete len:206 (-) Transcript_6589:709-1326(-)